MRLALLATLLLLPGAAAQASGVHLAWDGQGYVVTYQAPSAATVEGDAGAVTSTSRGALGGDTIWSAHLPATTRHYTVDGQPFDIGARPAADATMKVAFVADMGHDDATWSLLDAIAAAKPDLVIVGGDISYANGDAASWTDWLDHMQSLSSRVVTMTAMGNHETDCNEDALVCASEAHLYDALFPTVGGHRDYAFDWGGARLVALDTEAYHGAAAMGTGQTDAAAQKAMLAGALSARPDAWRIVYFHRPLYSSNIHDDGADDAAKRDLVPALEAGRADLVLYGHAHAYERSWPLLHDGVVATRDTTQRGEGIVYIDSGGGGRSLYSEFGAQPAWSAKRSAEYEFVLLTVSPTKLVSQAIRPDGSVLDTVTIERPAPATPTASTPAGSTPPTKAEVTADGHATPLVAPLLVVALVAAVAVARRRGR